MRTFTDDIQQSWIPRHGAVAWLIVLNVGVYLFFALGQFLLWIFGAGGAVNWALAQLSLPAQLGELMWRPWSLVTYGFIHYPLAFLHILFNMLWLFWFGRIMRQFLGDRHVWTTYFAGVLAGGVLYLLATNILPSLSNNSVLNGASAGVLAIVVATAVWRPDFTMHLLFFGAVKIKWIALVMVLLDVIFLGNAANPTAAAGLNAGGRVAHLGGALIGYLYIVSLRSGKDWAVAYDKITGLWSRAANRKKPRIVYDGRTAGASSGRSRDSQEEIDRILDKINAVGYDKLTKEEKQRLLNLDRDA